MEVFYDNAHAMAQGRCWFLFLFDLRLGKRENLVADRYAHVYGFRGFAALSLWPLLRFLKLFE